MPKLSEELFSLLKIQMTPVEKATGTIIMYLKLAAEQFQSHDLKFHIEPIDGTSALFIVEVLGETMSFRIDVSEMVEPEESA